MLLYELTGSSKLLVSDSWLWSLDIYTVAAQMIYVLESASVETNH